jgi:2-dehydropantoate 2-reductase
MPSIDTVSILGAGAMGSFYASKFYDMDRDSVSLVAKGDRRERLQKEGLVVNGTHYALPVLTPEDTSPPSDLILVAVKHHQLPEGIQDIRNRVGDHTVILSVMNGIDSEEQLGRAYGMDKLLYGVAVGIDAVREGNRTNYTTQGRLFFGEAENHTITPRVREIQALFDRAGIVYETPADMIRTLWWKFMINVGINQSSAVLRAPYGVFQRSPEAREIMESAMGEVMALAHAAGVDLTEKDIQEWITVLSNLGFAGKTSMLQDVEAGRKTEVEMLGGRVTELGKTYGIPTPVNQVLLRAIQVIEKYQEEKL